MLASWAFWALLSALFAALTAIFAKIGLDRVDSDFATFIRTLVILVTLGGILAVLGKFQAPGSIPPRSWLFLVLSGLATGAPGSAISAPSSSARRRWWRRWTSSAWCWWHCSAWPSSANAWTCANGSA